MDGHIYIVSQVHWLFATLNATNKKTARGKQNLLLASWPVSCLAYSLTLNMLAMFLLNAG
jgi:hypothetical protein